MIVQDMLNYRNVLRNGGRSYAVYLKRLIFLFLKMVRDQSRLIAEPTDKEEWSSLDTDVNCGVYEDLLKRTLLNPSRISEREDQFT